LGYDAEAYTIQNALTSIPMPTRFAINASFALTFLVSPELFLTYRLDSDKHEHMWFVRLIVY
jgi:hypothetical protein